MAEKILNSRIVNKHDSAENWSKATNFTPKQGEIIVYDIDENYNYERIKIGDGVQNVNALPFVDDALRTEILERINNVDTKVNEVSALVGDTSVAEQISEVTYTQTQVDELIATVKNFCLPKIRSITLTENNWVFSANYYYQDVPVGACTPTSKVDLQPTYSQLATWQDDGLAFTTQSKDGIVRVWAIPDAPKEDITVQISVQEVLGV